MIESIGNTIAAALSDMSYVSRAGGLTELIDVQNGENRQRIPGAKGYRETDGVFTGKPEDIASMAPDGSETCIAFVDVLNSTPHHYHALRTYCLLKSLLRLP